MRKSDWFVLLLGSLALGVAALVVVHPVLSADDARTRIALERALVEEYGLTDPCLFPEASYTRHLSMADVMAPFQNHPRALEHFPSGSHVAPPVRLWRGHAID
jgi:hypothetical protein